MIKLSGRSLIGFREGTGVGEPLHATDPSKGQRLQPGFVPATAEEVDLTARLAAEAFAIYNRTTGRERGAFLRKIAAKIESIAGEVIERGVQETALPQARLQGETARTCAQLRLFAQVAEEGSWVDARIDRADPGRKPASKPDIRSHAASAGPGRSVRRQQLPAGLLGCRRRYRFGAGGRKYRHCESACGPSRHQRTCGTRGSGKRSRVRPAGRRFLASVWQRRHRLAPP